MRGPSGPLPPKAARKTRREAATILPRSYNPPAVRHTLIATAVLALLAALVAAAQQPDTAAAPPLDGMALPTYTADGDLILPKDYRTWIFVGASLGLSYSEGAAEREGPGAFTNVYIQPEAYRYFMETGQFPEGTMLPMDIYRPGSRESINQAGYFEKDFLGMEVAVKDSERYEEGWAYLSFRDRSGGLRASASAFPKDRCYDCHAEHAATDNVFTQFYPVLQRGE